ncbi:MAG: SprT family zinc-dependent metalloprotease [Balneolaceae bacterium]|nr:SprT family zinc-dependent metalloprotease [Balneolaceae bacterium]
MFKRKPPKRSELHISGITILVTRKKVKNINLRVYPSRREVRISAPWYLRKKVIREFAESKLPWIQKHFSKFQKQSRQKELRYKSGEIHYYRGKALELEVIEKKSKPNVTYAPGEGKITLRVRPGASSGKRAKVLKEWYRAGLKEEIPKLIEKWEKPMGVSVREFGVKHMKTRWGSCNIRARRIWLNLELAKKSPACLESVVVHEMVHLLERLHNKRFYRLMDTFYPEWREIENELQGRVD